jgi:hypothetical protein
MGERIGRIRRIDTDFFVWISGLFQKKSVQICPIRPIRSPIVSHQHTKKPHTTRRYEADLKSNIEKF